MVLDDYFCFITIKRKLYFFGHKFRLSETNVDGSIEAILTRASNPAQDMHKTPFGTVAFITGNAHIEGKIEWKGKEFDITGCSIGSSFLIIY